uniref:Uncharacterized protein n=1 Tax=Arundo donax TaxID=35708 RepID=A0A0A8Y671_ARUDO
MEEPSRIEVQSTLWQPMASATILSCLRSRLACQSGLSCTAVPFAQR